MNENLKRITDLRDQWVAINTEISDLESDLHQIEDEIEHLSSEENKKENPWSEHD